MQKKTVIKATENEIIELIKRYINPKYESIVASEELDNQEWVVDVGPVDSIDQYQVRGIMVDGELQFATGTMLNMLCDRGILEAGEYIIDCRW